MTIRFVILALAACATNVVGDTETTVGSTTTEYKNQPVVVVRKTTYYEPELVALVVERGIDDVPEDSFIIQNYADVLAPANKEIRLCKSEKEECFDKPVTKLFVPRHFKSLGVQSFFDDAADLPWVSTIDKNVTVYNKPILVSRPTTKSSSIENEDTVAIKPEVTYKTIPLSSSFFKTGSSDITYTPYDTETEITKSVPLTYYSKGVHHPETQYEINHEPAQQYYHAQRSGASPYTEFSSPQVDYTENLKTIPFHTNVELRDPSYYSQITKQPIEVPAVRSSNDYVRVNPSTINYNIPSNYNHPVVRSADDYIRINPSTINYNAPSALRNINPNIRYF